jgi:high-affinity iron transporter
MLAAALIVFREVFEAGLVLGIVLGATRGVPGRGRWVAGGIGAGVAGACLVAAFAGVLADAMEGVGQEVLNAAVLGTAAVMLGWHNIWMARHGREMAGEMKALGRDVAAGGRTLLALAVVIGAAVLREGAEVVLFLYGLAAGGDGAAALAGGSVLGIAGGIAVSVLLYRGLVSIPTRHLFKVTNVLLSLMAAGMAAGMAAQAAGFLVQADLLPALGARVWDTSWLLDQKGLPGRALHALVGYTDRPTGVQVLVYGLVLGVLLLAGRLLGARPVMGRGIAAQRG